MEREKFSKLLKENSFEIYSEKQREQFENYIALLAKWNKVYNLTAVKTLEEMVIRHIFDSLAVAPFIKGNRIIDVGTGAGLPGIPLAIAKPNKQFTLLDSSGKKTKFLMQVKIELNLSNIEIVQSRVENYVPETCFDIVISRAFASLKKMLLLTRHCAGGCFLALKGQLREEELKDIPAGFVVEEIIPLEVPHLKEARYLICIKDKLSSFPSSTLSSVKRETHA
jgi:16S rRNA (guanine527-N7)-methyltransferase